MVMNIIFLWSFYIQCHEYAYSQNNPQYFPAQYESSISDMGEVGISFHFIKMKIKDFNIHLFHSILSISASFDASTFIKHFSPKILLISWKLINIPYWSCYTCYDISIYTYMLRMMKYVYTGCGSLQFKIWTYNL